MIQNLPVKQAALLLITGRFSDSVLFLSDNSENVDQFFLFIHWLDKAYMNSRLECIAVKNNTIWMLTLPMNEQKELIDVLTVIGQKQN